MGREPEQLVVLVGTDLAQVVFVRDYVQLGFERPHEFPWLTAVTLPVVWTGGTPRRSGESGYCDALVSQINKVVAAASAEEGEEIRVTFRDGDAITISLHPDDYVTAEAARLDVQPASFRVW